MTTAKPITDEDLQALLEYNYHVGFIDGLRAYAHWKDGIEYVGTAGRTLDEAIAKLQDTWNYNAGLIDASNRP